jgi:formate hydrogenlyase transcriptional activator
MTDAVSSSSTRGPEDDLTAATATNAQLRRIIDAIPVLAWCNLPDGSNEFLNQRWQEYTGLSQAEASGWGWKVTFHPDDLDPLLERWRSLLMSGEPGEIEARLRRHDGVYRWFLIRVEPLRDERGNIVRWYGTSTDIDDLKRAQEELRTITDAIPQAIIVQSPEGVPLYINRVARDYTGLSLEDVGADNYRARVFHPEDVERVREDRKASLARAVAFSIEQRARGRDGRYRWFLIHYNPLLDADGRIVRWYATGTDIDERKRREDRMRNENLALREDIARSSMFEAIVGRSEALRRVLDQVAKVAATDSTVLILGETGTGKELVARAIHERSNRSKGAFIRVNCGAIPPTLIASELFGHEKGAFTGALQRRLGRFESADGGTIFLDEVGELPPATQVALLRVLQEREFERVGGTRAISVDVRVIAATNRDLSAAVADGNFRRDLYYRLNVFPVQLPALRDRIGDIPLLVEYLIGQYARKAGKVIRRVSQETLDELQAYDWPGNVRELQNVIERGVILCEGDTLYIDPTWLARADGNLRKPHLIADLAEREKALIEEALRESEGSITGPAGAAARLGIPRQTLQSKIKKLGIDRRHFRA